jgi:predicted 3-demethylubiquinone-9 3-methyltransferase (glyoxalase superfamily)
LTAEVKKFKILGKIKNYQPKKGNVMTNIKAKPMQKISPCLWFDGQAEEAVSFYTSLFENSHIGKISRYGETGQEAHGRPAGSVMTVEFQLEGQTFLALNGGPHFRFNPSISFFISCDSEEEVERLWSQLLSGSDAGSVLMPLQEYPFSERYGWVQDKYDLSWQVMLTRDQEIKQKITPSLLFVGDQTGKAEEAMHFYTSIFDSANISTVSRYGKGEEPNKEGTVNYAAFTLEGQGFTAMDSNLEHSFTFNEAISLVVNCQTQEEVDGYWEKLSAVPEAEQCGWLKDKYGLSWQIVPITLSELMGDPDPEKSGRVMEAMLQMKKINIRGLKQAYVQEQ